MAQLSVLPPLGAGGDQTYVPDRYKGIILNAPDPDIPGVGYSNNKIQGLGVYRLIINPATGVVDEVKILTAIGSPRVDASAVWTLFQWRFRPRTLRQIDVPIWYGRNFEAVLKNATGK